MATNQIVSEEKIWDSIRLITDPEIPAVTLAELGIIRKVEVEQEGVRVVITPTFSGCPALQVMRAQIADAIRERFQNLQVRVETQIAPPWTSDWITAAGRAKLKAFGLAPPNPHGGNILISLEEDVQCPYCDSTQTILKNNWGPTPCRMIYTCNACRQPFERFKPL